MVSAMCMWIGKGQPGTITGKPSSLKLMSSSSRFGPNFSCLAYRRSESIGYRPIRISLACNAQ